MVHVGTEGSRPSALESEQRMSIVVVCVIPTWRSKKRARFGCPLTIHFATPNDPRQTLGGPSESAPAGFDSEPAIGSSVKSKGRRVSFGFFRLFSIEDFEAIGAIHGNTEVSLTRIATEIALLYHKLRAPEISVTCLECKYLTTSS